MAARLVFYICCCWPHMSFCARAFQTSYRRPILTMAPRVAAAKTKQATDHDLAGDGSIAGAAAPALSQATMRKRSAPTDSSATSTSTTSSGTPEAPTETTAPKKNKSPAHQVLTDRDEIPKLWDEEKAKSNGSYSECLSLPFVVLA